MQEQSVAPRSIVEMGWSTKPLDHVVSREEARIRLIAARLQDGVPFEQATREVPKEAKPEDRFHDVDFYQHKLLEALLDATDALYLKCNDEIAKTQYIMQRHSMALIFPELAGWFHDNPKPGEERAHNEDNPFNYYAAVTAAKRKKAAFITENA